MPACHLPQLDQFEFHHRLARTPGVAIVMFTSRGCASCRAWKSVLADHRRRQLETHVYEVDAERELALTREFEVFHLPALFLYVDGRFHGALHSEAHPERFAAAVAAAVAAPAQDAP
jgi:glutaredoxin